jgi:predicted nucleotidyltransferase
MARLIVAGELKGVPVRIFLFGSRARGQSAPGSDIDIALLAESPLPRSLLSRMRESLEESTIPVHVDVVDLAVADETFRRAVLAEAVEWTV